MSRKTIEEVIAEATSNRRVCPQPQLWNQLWEMLPERKRVGASWQPAPPLILAAWWEASDAAKRERFIEHLECANARGALDSIAKFLSSLTNEQWHIEA